MGRRDRIADPVEAVVLLAALPVEDRPIWATAFYAGLRLGERKELRWEDVTLATGLLRVERGWDVVQGEIDAPKSREGRRSVPIPAVLRTALLEHRLRRMACAAAGHRWLRQGRAGRAWCSGAPRRGHSQKGAAEAGSRGVGRGVADAHQPG